MTILGIASTLCLHGKINLLQYADDTSLISDGSSFCQHVLCLTESWLTWSGMAANVPKCVTVAIKASTGRAYNPNLTLSGQPIPYLTDTNFQFLGAPVAIHSTSDESREHLVTKLSSMMQRIDDTFVTCQQKLKLFKVSICPRLTWHLSILDLPVSWLRNTLQPIATRYLKRWSGLSRSADPNRLFLPKSITVDLNCLTCSQSTRRSRLLRLGLTCSHVTRMLETLPSLTHSMKTASSASCFDLTRKL